MMDDQATAKEFFTHPKIQNVSVYEKIKFLKSKGLSNQQIYSALASIDRRVADDPNVLQAISTSSSGSHIVSKIFGWAAVIAAVVGVVWRFVENKASQAEVAEAEEQEEEKIRQEWSSVQECRKLDNELRHTLNSLRESNSESSILLRELALQSSKQRKSLSTSDVDLRSGTYKKAELPNSIKALFASKIN
jgi:hypothetical protein